MASEPLSPDPADVLEIHDPEIDVDALMERVRAAVRARGEVPLADVPVNSRASRLLEAVLRLHTEAARLGEISVARGGWIGRLEFLARRVVRKLLSPYLKQQQAIHEAIVQAIDLLVAELVEGRD